MLSTKSKQIERVQFLEKLVRHCCKNCNNVEVTFDFFKKIVKLVAFDNVDGALETTTSVVQTAAEITLTMTIV